MSVIRYLPLALVAVLAASCGQAGVTAAKPAASSPVRATVAPGATVPLDLPAQSFRLVLELRNGLQAQALPAAAASVVVTVTGGQLASAFTQTILASQFINNTAQLILSGLNAGSYNVSAVVKDSGGNTIVSGSMDVGVVAGQATSANLVLIYGTAATPGTLNEQIDQIPPAVAITSIGLDPATLPGPGYPARLTVTTDQDARGGLTYRYAADGGRFSGNGRQVLWTAPDNQGGTFTLTATVLDGVHAPVSQTITATVPVGSGTVTGSISFINFS